MFGSSPRSLLFCLVGIPGHICTITQHSLARLHSFVLPAARAKLNYFQQRCYFREWCLWACPRHFQDHCLEPSRKGGSCHFADPMQVPRGHNDFTLTVKCLKSLADIYGRQLSNESRVKAGRMGSSGLYLETNKLEKASVLVRECLIDLYPTSWYLHAITILVLDFFFLPRVWFANRKTHIYLSVCFNQLLNLFFF